MREAQLASVSKNEEPRAFVGVGGGVHLSKLHGHVVRGWIYWGSTPLQGLSRVELAVIKTPSITALTASPGDPGSARPTGNFRPCPWKKGMEKEKCWGEWKGERWFITARPFFFRKRRRWWSGRGVKRRWNREASGRKVSLDLGHTGDCICKVNENRSWPAGFRRERLLF